MLDPVKEYCARRGYASFVIEGGLDYLVPHWERVVMDVARGYRLTRDDYLNDMDARRILNEALQVATPAQAAQVTERIKVADETFIAHTIAVETCIWGHHHEEKYGYSARIDWWYYREPKVRHHGW